MGTIATFDWIEREGQRTNMVNGRSGFAEVAETSQRDDTTEKEIVDFRGNIGQLEVALGDPSDRFNVLRSKPLNIQFRGAGKGDAQSVLSGLQTGGRSLPGANLPIPIHRLEFTDCLIDVRGKGTYPIGTGVNTRAGVFGFKRALVRSEGLAGKVLTVIRGMACAAYQMADIDAPDGADEYLGYVNHGPNLTDHDGTVLGTFFRRVTGASFGRGLWQDALRTTENNFYQPATEGGTVEVSDIYATNTGSAGAGVVNVWGGDEVRVTNVNCDTPWATFAVAVGFDSKQAEVTGTSGNYTIVGPGKLLDGRAMGNVIVDLRRSKIRTGTKQGGTAALSGRPAVGIDSAATVYLVSDENTVVQSGGHGLELEWNGSGAIKTNKGVAVGSRSIGQVTTSGVFSGWDSFRQGGMAYHPDEDMSERR